MSKFVLFEGKDEQWYWNLKANNGEIIATSEGYVSKSGAMNSIQTVKKLALDAKIEFKE